MEGLERLERLLAAILIHDMRDAPQGEKALQLSRAGMTNTEIAALLGTTAQVINQQLYAQRRATKKGGTRKAGVKKKPKH